MTGASSHLAMEDQCGTQASPIAVPSAVSADDSSQEELAEPPNSLVDKQSTNTKSRASFLDLPAELRNEIYSLMVLFEDPIDPSMNWASMSWIITPGLLRANKIISHEASSMFYGSNCFYLKDATPKKPSSFLAEIGVRNAANIRHIMIDFPLWRYLDSSYVGLEVDSISTLAAINNNCTNLRTLTTSVSSTYATERVLDERVDKVASEVLELVDTHFRSLTSLKEIIVMVLGGHRGFYPKPLIREIMRTLEWTIKVIKENQWTDSEDDDYYDDLYSSCLTAYDRYRDDDDESNDDVSHHDRNNDSDA
ncbi:hypothetical protein F5Y18DRAFT_444937 [Xylariaceae sp. FL1019]|nr:hypothetical protein F5Y18DRAFT_444937 [Xylariaceae sp. FL1019]